MNIGDLMTFLHRTGTDAPASLPRATALGLVAALCLTSAAYALARATGENLTVSAPGQAAGAISLTAVWVSTVAGGLPAGVGVVLARRTPRPRTTFAALAAVSLAASFIPPFAAADTTSTALWLCALHVAVAVGIVPALVRTLAGGAR